VEGNVCKCLFWCFSSDLSSAPNLVFKKHKAEMRSKN